MVAELMFDGVGARAGEDHLPGSPCVTAPPESRVPGVDHLRGHGIEGKYINSAAEIKHVPRLAIVAAYVTAGHIAVLNDEMGIDGADGWADRSAASAGSDDFPAVRVRSLRNGGKRGEDQQDCEARPL